MDRLPFNKLMLVILAALVVWGCATNSVEKGPADTALKPQRPVLRVGVTPNYPPMIFKLNNKITGMEADFAFLLGDALGRDVAFVELPFTTLTNALMEGRIDIIMSGMTITQARQVRVSFTDSYLRIGQVAMMRVQDASKYNSLMRIRECDGPVGVVKGTTGEAYVRANFTKASPIITVEDVRDGARILNNRRVDLFVYDVPAIVWLVSENETTLKGFWEPLNDEYLAWAVNRDDQTLLRAVNTALANWKRSGTVNEVVKKWLPYWKSSE
ncbi:MAG: Glutamine-binding periplasmic protein precursor [Syntrophorhabdus sp. PtaU1.Bin153]|nr:MAG: Glutamine-binding periplasmic protein precursor [Syntrophorhabdus sp. PtaU1.Bin153]